jgi:hypothetical protein
VVDQVVERGILAVLPQVVRVQQVKVTRVVQALLVLLAPEVEVAVQVRPE